MFKEISTNELKEWMDIQHVKIVDVRPVDAYNGWAFQKEPRGGHIRGAKSVAAKWAHYIDWIEIVRSKGILPEHTIVLYGYSAEEIQKVALCFKQANYPKVYVYHHFLDEWSPNNDLPMDYLPRFKQLVPASWVKEIIIGENTNGSARKKAVIVHAHYRNRDAYLSGHIPGAIDMDTLALEAPETWNRRSPKELEQALLEHGITANTTVILYGKFMFPDNDDEFPGSAAGDIGAIRNAFIMMYAGVKDVRILNGGFQSWEDAGYEISHDDVPKIPALNFEAHIPMKPELAVDLPEAKEMLASPNAELVCVRS